MNFCIFVLALAHRDPSIKGFRKLGCFSKKGFEALRRLFKEVILKRDELGITSSVSDGRKKYLSRLCAAHRQEGRYSSKYSEIAFEIIIRRKEKTWWDKERWGDAYDLENPWSDLSIA